MNTNPSDTARILRKAADVVETRGWHQGNAVDPNGTGVCAIGAIKAALGLKPDADMFYLGRDINDLLIRAINQTEKQIGEYWLNIWNDDVAKSAGQVTAALRAAAETAEVTR